MNTNTLGHSIHLPKTHGRYLFNTRLARYSWLRVGGSADVLFLPADANDLANVLAELPREFPVTTIGVGSNILVRDGGVRGMVVRLGRAFANVKIEDKQRIRVGAATLDGVLARTALEANIAGFEFLDGIPGTVGGALRMNAGAHGEDVAGVLIEAVALDRDGKRHVFNKKDMDFSYRHCGIDGDVIFLEALLQGRKSSHEKIEARLETLRKKRIASQPIRAFTGGSTFKNPSESHSSESRSKGGKKAWQLIEATGCRDMRKGDAMFSPQHCNFLVNAGNASASDIESLGEEVRKRVHEKTGITLEWEIVRIGEKEVVT